jgi:lipoyl(octanoyl) transferase
MIEIRDLGLLPYQTAWELQLSLLAERAEGKIPDTLLVVEHPQVFTLGRKSPGVREQTELPKELGGIPVFPVERGGEATYHGPGQAVLYPIFQLDLMKTGPRVFLRLLENAIIEVLALHGVEGYWQDGKTGVWVKDSQGRERKIASLGIAVRRSVGYHGLALNVNNDLTPFRLIQPCGFAPEVMTNLSELLGREVNFHEVNKQLAQAVIRGFEKVKQ